MAEPKKKYGFVVKDSTYNRKCSRCHKQLPLTRYFNHIDCVENLEDDSMFLYESVGYLGKPPLRPIRRAG